MANVLIFSNVAVWQVHHVQTLEIIRKHISLGDNVFLVSCKGQLASCAPNPNHIGSVCKFCIKQTNYSIKNLIPKSVITIDLDFRSFPTEFLEFIPNTFDSQKQFEDLYFRDMPVGKLALSQLMDIKQDILVDLNTINTQGIVLVKDAIALFIEISNLIKKHHIEIVYVWNGRRNSDGPALYAAKEIGIRQYSYISGANPQKYYFHENSMDSLTDWKKSISNFEKSNVLFNFSEDADIYFRNLKSGEDSSVGYRWYQEENATNFEPVLKTSDKLQLLICTSSYWEYYNSPDRSSLSFDFMNPYDLILRICQDSSLQKKYDFSIRWHPNLANAGIGEQNEINRVINMTQKVIHFRPEMKVNSYKLLELSDVVVTNGSTIGIEAAFIGKVVVTAGLSIYGGLGSTYEPTDFSELKYLLLSDLKPLGKKGADTYGAFMKNFGFDFEHFNYKGKGNYVLGDIPVVGINKIKKTFLYLFLRKFKFRKYDE